MLRNHCHFQWFFNKLLADTMRNSHHIEEALVQEDSQYDGCTSPGVEHQLHLFSTCLANLNDMVLITEAGLLNEPGPRIVFVNKAFERVSGYTSAEVIGRSPRFLQGDKTDRQVLRDIRLALERQQPIRRQIINYTKEGNQYWLDIDVVPIFDTAGKCTHFVAIQRDITDSKHSEEWIAEQAAVLDKARDAIFMRDMEGRVFFWNKGAESTYGWTGQEVMGKKVQGFLFADPKKFIEVTNETVKRGQWRSEIQHLTKDGRTLMIESSWTLMRDDEGLPKSVLVINNDITERKRIQAQLMRAQRIETAGALASGIAHDLNNILAPIMMAVGPLQTMVESSEARSLLNTIEVAAKRGADIVQQQLSFGKGLETTCLEVHPRHLLKDIEHIIHATFPKNIELQIFVPADVSTIIADPTQLHQVLVSLCVNARDAMPNGGLLKLRAENCQLNEQDIVMDIEANPGPYLVITIGDSGMGIPPGVLDKIFDPFFTTKEISKGSGLGLSMVMAIVKGHQGFVRVCSEPGAGTTLKLYLPAQIDQKKGGLRAEESDLPRGNGETVLVVDDEASILIVTSQTLRAFGYRVLTARDGEEALAIFSNQKNDVAVVLTDMIMPVMDGPATIQALLGISPRLKIIAASGLNGTAASTASAAGTPYFLAKPYTAATLLKTLKSILNES